MAFAVHAVRASGASLALMNTFVSKGQPLGQW